MPPNEVVCILYDIKTNIIWFQLSIQKETVFVFFLPYCLPHNTSPFMLCIIVSSNDNIHTYVQLTNLFCCVKNIINGAICFINLASFQI